MAAGLALTAGIGQILGGRGLAVVILLVVFAVNRAVISWVPMDPTYAKWTRIGWIHFVLAFVAMPAAASVLGLSFPTQADGTHWLDRAQAMALPRADPSG